MEIYNISWNYFSTQRVKYQYYNVPAGYRISITQLTRWVLVLVTDNIFKCMFLNETVWIPIKISLKCVPKGPLNNIPALVQIMAWRRPGDKPLSEPMMVAFTDHRLWPLHSQVLQGQVTIVICEAPVFRLGIFSLWVTGSRRANIYSLQKTCYADRRITEICPVSLADFSVDLLTLIVVNLT